MENICVYGVLVEIVEIFEHHVLVQDPVTMAVFLVEYQHIDPIDAVKYNDRCDSNVISLKGWKQWPRKTNASGKKRARRQTPVEPKVLSMVR